MKKYINGSIVVATSEDIMEWNKQSEHDIQEPPPTVEDRVQILEEALEFLLSGATS